MRRCQAFFKQQTHRVTFVTKRRLNTHQHIAKLLAQDKNGTAVAELTARCRAPLRFNFFEPALTFDVIVSRDQSMHIGVCAMLCRIAIQQGIAQFVHAGWHIDLVTLRLHGGQGVPQRFENRQECGRANVACIGREVEQHNGHVAVFAFAAFQGHHLAHPGCQHDGALWARVHVLCVAAFTKRTSMVTAIACHTCRAWTSAKHHRAGRAIKFGDCHHDGAFNRQQAAV